ncbi:MAG: toprim domain-containing protein [Sedimenticola sp.]
MKTADLARGRWPEILRAFGIEERYLTGRHTGCPLCGQGKDTFRFDDKDGDGTYYCGKCGPGNGLSFVMKWLGVEFKDAAKRVDEILGQVEPIQPKAEIRKDPRPALRNIAQGAKPLTGDDPASVYLRNRGLSVVSQELRWHPSLTYWDSNGTGKPIQRGRFPAMVVPIRDQNGDALTYHVTYLDQGHKAEVSNPKKIMTPVSPIKGGAIQLFPAGKQLAVAEGIETALAFYEAFEIPVWATSNAGNMETLVIPPEVEELTIVADNDASFTGQKAAYTLAHRFKATGKFAEVICEGEEGQDFLDVFNKTNAA